MGYYDDHGWNEVEDRNQTALDVVVMVVAYAFWAAFLGFLGAIIWGLWLQIYG